MPLRRPTSSWLPPVDPKWLAIVLALGATAWTLLSQRYIPFQDFPNHVHLLEVDRRLGAPTDYLARSEIHTLGYSLYIWISRLLAPVLSARSVLRLLVVITAMATPLAAGVAADALGISVPWTILLAAPLGVSWPMRVGLVPYVIAIPPAVLAIAAAVRSEDRPPRRWGDTVKLVVFTTLTYLAHAYVFLCLCFALSVGVALLSRDRLRALLSTLGAMIPGLLLLGHDLRQHAFDPIAATSVTLFHAPRWYRPLHVALAHLATRSYGITGVRTLYAFMPLLLLVPGAAAMTWFRREGLPRPGARVFLWTMALAGSVGTLALPESQGLVFLLASRTLILGAIFFTLLAASVASHTRSLLLRVAFAAAPLIALSASLGEIGERGREVARVAGADGPARQNGRFLTVQVPDCAQASSLYWGGYDSFRHLWAYAIGKNGITPYLFSASRYQPIWYRSDTFRELLRGPPEHPMNENERPAGPEECRELAKERLAIATSWSDYDGVIVTRAAGELDDVLEPGEQRVVRPIAPGMALVAGAPTGPRAFVDFGTPTGRAHLEDGWSGDERIDDRTTVWSDGPSSTIVFSLAPVDAEYVITLVAKGIASETIGVSLNDHDLGSVAVDKSWARAHVAVTPELLKAGKNRLTLTYPPDRELPASDDPRKLALLVDELSVEPVGDPLSLIFGTRSSRQHLVFGWSSDELSQGRPAVRAKDAHPRLGFFFRRKPRPVRLRITAAWPESLPLAVSLNDRPLGIFERKSPDVAALVMSPGALRTGWNELELWDARGRDERLDVALFELSLEGESPRTLDVLPARPEDRPYLAGGWSAPRSAEGVEVAAIDTDGAALRFAFDLPSASSYVIGLHGRAVPRSEGAADHEDARVEVRLNQRAVATLELPQAWTLATAVLDGAMRDPRSVGDNLLELRPLTADARGGATPPRSVEVHELMLLSADTSDQIDVGEPEHRSRLRNGFSGDERVDGRTCAWTDQRSARLVFYVVPAAADYEIAFTAHAYAPLAPVELDLVLNGHPLGRARLSASWTEEHIRVAHPYLKAGANVLDLALSATGRPEQFERGSLDRRELGALFDEFRLEPINGNSASGHSAVH